MMRAQSMFPEIRAAILKANEWLAPWAENWVKATGFQGPGAKGWARRGRLYICPHACTLPGRGYSWPGSVSDCTVRGVYLHEIGHVVHAALDGREAHVLQALWEVKEPKVTGYEPNPMERFAETFRLYMGNPGLLAEGRPRRFQVMQEVAKIALIKPVRPWVHGLEGNPPARFLDQCERWILCNKNRAATLF